MRSNTRQDILKSSRKLFFKNGFYKTTMSEIAGACGIKKASIYHHFGSKEELLKSVIYVLDSDFRENTNIISSNKKIDGTIRMSRMLSFIEDYVFRQDGCIMAILAMEVRSTYPDIQKGIIQFYRLWVTAFKNIYIDYYDDPTATEISEELVINMQGAVMWINISGDTAPIKKLIAKTNNSLPTLQRPIPISSLTPCHQ